MSPDRCFKRGSSSREHVMQKHDHVTGMADSQRTVQPWTDPPEAELRRVKTMVEDELLIKLGAKKEAVSSFRDFFFFDKCKKTFK